MHGLNRPLTIFTSKKPFNDRNTDDMKCGDMDARTLKQRFHLDQVSTYIDWCTYKSPYKHPAINNIPPVSKERAISMLFDELRNSSWIFSFHGPYQGLVATLLNHMQYKNGADFRDVRLDQAYKSLILSDRSDTSTLSQIKGVLDNFKFKETTLTKEAFSRSMLNTRLPKYVRWKDWINGMGITVHGVNSTEISIESLIFQNNKYTAVIRYKAQDHFGLDSDDITNLKFNTINFFRIWFVLQRYNKFACKPFFTNFETKITITGESNV